MKICNVVPFFAPHFGGVVDRCFHITKELAKRGHTVTLCTSDYQYDHGYSNALKNVDIRVFPSYLGRFCITPGLKKYLDQNAGQYDVFHLINNYSYVNIVASNICFKKNIPFMYSAMGSLPIMSRSHIRKYIFNKSIGKHIVRKASALCSITDQESSQYMSYDKGVTSKKIFKIPNAIDDPFDTSITGRSFRERFNIPDESKIILFVGRLEYIKGVDLLINAFNKIHTNNTDTMLVIVGPDFGEKGNLIKLVHKYGLDNKILLTGPLYARDKYSAYAAAHFLVVPSRHENMSIVALEGAAWELPIVITNTSGFPEIETEHAGYVVTATPDGIADGMDRIIRYNHDYTNYCKNARAMVMENYLWDNIGEMMEKALLSII